MSIFRKLKKIYLKYAESWCLNIQYIVMDEKIDLTVLSIQISKTASPAKAIFCIAPKCALYSPSPSQKQLKNFESKHHHDPRRKLYPGNIQSIFRTWDLHLLLLLPFSCIEEDIYIWRGWTAHTEPLYVVFRRPAGSICRHLSKAESQKKKLFVWVPLVRILMFRRSWVQNLTTQQPPTTNLFCPLFFFLDWRLGGWGREEVGGKLPTRTTYFIHNLFFCALWRVLLRRENVTECVCVSLYHFPEKIEPLFSRATPVTRGGKILLKNCSINFTLVPRKIGLSQLEHISHRCHFLTNILAIALFCHSFKKAKLCLPCGPRCGSSVQ